MPHRFFIRDIYYFFLQNIGRSQNELLPLEDFLKTCPGYIIEDTGDGFQKVDMSMLYRMLSFCEKMKDEALLMEMYKYPIAPFLNKYISVDKVNSSDPESFQHAIDYGCYDFKFQGFQFTRKYFIDSVLPIVGENLDGDEDIGTCFYLGNNKFATAAHCITGLKSFNILDGDDRPLSLKEVWFAEGENKNDFDLAIVTVEDKIEIPSFDLSEPEVLEEVLAMGYPPIPGINPILTAEKASVGAFVRGNQKGAVGEVVSDAKTYFNDLDYFLINARVKGGNSGGPVINSCGQVVGIVVQIPLDSVGGMGSGRFDVMGYGICLDSKYLKVLESKPEIHKLTFDGNSYGLS